ncbi:MAG TPA: DNA polymerase III subunit delta [Pyrinomonadaceae bacterium]|nr:DNA polymerase III subunit delta [Pyrinomonadaceae bacterium]HMP65501.1 DNA polymerase III subunit delta [Pyrinomonadaceae bacterium]
MPRLTIDQLREHTRKGELFPVYVLHGKETFRRNIAARFIADRAFSEGELREFNEDAISLSEPERFRDVLTAAEQLPMLASRRVIRATDVAVSSTPAKDTLKEEYEEPLSEYLRSPSPQTVLLLIADELNGNRKITKLLVKHAAVVEFAAPEGRELREWAVKEFRSQDAEIDSSALTHLLNLVGTDLWRLSNQISKLVTAAKPNRTVTKDLVDLHVERSDEADHFGLAEPLVANRRRESLTMLKKLHDDGAEPLGQIGILGYNLRKLAMSGRGTGPQSDRIRQSILRNAETDIAIKTSVGGPGPAGARLQFEKLVLEMLMSGKD